MTTTPEHPEELLAPYVDGALDASARAGVDAHLASCERCREEVELATRARTALRALPEPAVPASIGRVVARRVDRLEAAAGPRWASRLGLAAAAAIVVLGAVVIVPRLGSDGDRGAVTAMASDAAQEEADAPAFAGEGAIGALPDAVRPPSLERLDRDYDAQSVADLAREVARNPVPGAGAADPAASSEASFERDAEEFRDAIRCTERWAEDLEGGVALRVIEATYEGAPAYLGVYRRDAEDGSDVLVWVLGRAGCDLITLTEQSV